MLWKNKELLDQIQWVLSTNIQIQDSIVLQESNLERIDKSRLPQAFVQNADLKEQSKHRSKFETFFQVFQEEWKNKVEDDAKEPSTFSFLQDGRKRTKGIQDLYHALCQPPVVRDGCTYKHCPQLEDVLRLQPEQYTFYQGYHFFFHRMTPELFRSQQKSIKALLGKDLAPVQPHEYLLRVVMEPLFEQERVASVVGVLRATVTQKTLTYHSIKSADLPFPFSYSLGKILYAIMLQYSVLKVDKVFQQSVCFENEIVWISRRCGTRQSCPIVEVCPIVVQRIDSSCGTFVRIATCGSVHVVLCPSGGRVLSFVSWRSVDSRTTVQSDRRHEEFENSCPKTRFALENHNTFFVRRLQ